MSFCSQCGNENPESVKFCGKCGKPVNQAAQSPQASGQPKQPKSQRSGLPVPVIAGAAIAVVAIVLAVIFLGGGASAAEPFVDSRDGKEYKAVKIGDQIWMAENLNYNAPGSKCYDNDPDNCARYGRLYNWNTALRACPEGWHLPTDKEQHALMSFANYDGKKLKAKSGWDDYDGKSGNGSDKYGFSALPGGSDLLGANDDETVSGKFGGWWTATATDVTDVTETASFRMITYNSDDVVFQVGLNKFLLSVRCVKDEPFDYIEAEELSASMKNLEKKSEKPRKKSTQSEPEAQEPQMLIEKKVSAHSLMKDQSFSKDLDKALAAAGLQTDMLGGLMGGSAGGIGTKARGSMKAPSARDIDMGSGDGSRSKAEIMAVVNSRMPGLRNIYNKYLKLKPDFSGKVTLKFTIAPGGDIVGISIVSSTTGYSEFDNAVKNMVQTWKWKAIKSGNTTPTIPFTFTE